MTNGVDAAARELVLAARSFEAGKCAFSSGDAALSAWRDWSVTVEGLLPSNDGPARVASFSAFCHGWLAASEAA